MVIPVHKTTVWRTVQISNHSNYLLILLNLDFPHLAASSSSSSASVDSCSFEATAIRGGICNAGKNAIKAMIAAASGASSSPPSWELFTGNDCFIRKLYILSNGRYGATSSRAMADPRRKIDYQDRHPSVRPSTPVRVCATIDDVHDTLWSSARTATALASSNEYKVHISLVKA